MSLGFRDRFIQAGGSRCDRAAERTLLGVSDARDSLVVLSDLRINANHRVTRYRQQLREYGVGNSHEAHRTDSAANQATQNVATALIGRRNSVADEHECGTHVVSNDAQTNVICIAWVLWVLSRGVRLTCKLSGTVKNWTDLVGLVHVLNALEDHRKAFKTEARIDVALRKLTGNIEVSLGTDRGEAVLHEHEVPDLDVASLINRWAAFLAVGWATVVVDLRAWPTRSRLACVPVVIGLTGTDDALGRYADLVFPDAASLIISVISVFVHRDPQAFRIQAVTAVGNRRGQQFPRPRDRFFLEVVTEGEVTVHLEERAVAGRLADLFDIGSADALLDRNRARIRRRFDSRQVRDERNHAGDGEQQ